ncbi:MAG: PAS domain-containing protein [Bacteroidales bacterium]
MAEIINNSHKRIEILVDFSRRLIDGENVRMLIEKHHQIINTVSPIETMQVLDELLLKGLSHEAVKKNVGKIINVFFKSLSSYQWEKPIEGHFLYYLMLENREVQKILTELKSVTKSYFKEENQDIPGLIRNLSLLVEKLKAYELHYIKKENILFPYIERTFPQYRCLQLMWSFHDDFRRCLKALDTILRSEIPDNEQLNKEIGKLFFVVLPIVFREEQIVFPVALKAIPEKAWTEMLDQSYVTGWCFIDQPIRTYNTNQISYNSDGKINLGTGFLNPEQLVLLLDNLTVDITFIDENDEVLYFSGAKHRIFHRSEAIIGRKVQNCHPPDSVHIVNKIITAFRNGEKDSADFWIQMKDRFIYIRYFALRNEQCIYKGTIEVSQDVTDIKSLQGERRLLEWNKE